MKHGVMLPSSFVLMERALAEIEGVCRTLDSAFDITKLAQDNLEMMIGARYSPKLDPMQAVETARQYRELLRELPAKLDKVLRKVESGDFTVKVDRSLFDDVKLSLRRMANMMAVTLMAAALVIYIGWEGQAIRLQLVHTTVGVTAVVLAWAIAMVVLARRK